MENCHGEKKPGKVLVAVSGGVDSSVAMMLLREEGYDVAAAHMKLWDYEEVGGDSFKDGRCCSLEAINDLRSICTKHDIPFYVLDYSNEFRETVIENFVSEYKSGRTPNPCILCNTHLKWRHLWNKALQIGCDYIATGHYATIFNDKRAARFTIKKGDDPSRDQSYALWGLSQEALAGTILPLGKYHKKEIRDIARRLKLKNSEQPESREICFVADDDYRRFLNEWENKRGRSFSSGNIVKTDGEIIGQHKGIAFYTIGQRRGLGLSHPTPLYVQDVDPNKNLVIVGDNATLFKNEMRVSEINWMALESPTASFRADVKIRYLHSATPAEIFPEKNNRAKVVFDYPQRAITPGQSTVFYENDIVLGGGLID